LKRNKQSFEIVEKEKFQISEKTQKELRKKYRKISFSSLIGENVHFGFNHESLEFTKILFRKAAAICDA
jgi:hypothetical protein